MQIPADPVPVLSSPTNWWQRSEAAKAALRALIQGGTVKLETGAMEDELDSHDLAFIAADRSDNCHQATAATVLRSTVATARRDRNPLYHILPFDPFQMSRPSVPAAYE